MFVDMQNRDVLDFKKELQRDGDVLGEIVRIPAGYSLRTKHVALNLTRHSFNISLDGRVIKEMPIPKSVKWSTSNVLYNLNANQVATLVFNQEFNFTRSDITKYRSPFRTPNLVFDRNVGSIYSVTGTLLQVLNFLGHVNEKNNLDYSVLRLVPAGEREFEKFYKHNLLSKEGRHAWLMKSDGDLYQAISEANRPQELEDDDFYVIGIRAQDLDIDTHFAYKGIDFQDNEDDKLLISKLRNPYVVVYAEPDVVLKGKRMYLNDHSNS